MLKWPFDGKKKRILKAERSSSISIKETPEVNGFEGIVNKLKEVLGKTDKEVIIMCVGSDRSTGDSLGPLVGKMLKEKEIPFPVYGTLEKPVHAMNIEKILKGIYKTHNEPFILGIDACLGDERQIGFILLKEGSFIPGHALNKALPSVGDYHLKAIVNNLDTISPAQALNSTRLFIVMRLAEIITEIITLAALVDPTSSIIKTEDIGNKKNLL